MGYPGFGTGREDETGRIFRHHDDSPFTAGPDSQAAEAFTAPSAQDSHSSPESDPLDFFAESMEPKKSTAGRRMILLAGSAGAILGLVAVSLFITLMEGRGTAAVRADLPASTKADVPWQRPVISAKTDLETAITQSAALNPSLPLSLGDNRNTAKAAEAPP